MYSLFLGSDILAKSYDTEVFSQNSIYNKSIQSIENNRKIRVYFSIPEKGINEDTGLLLLISGYGGKASSNIYKKMRSQFADEYNLVTIQCDYFGYEFMQLAENICPNIDQEKLKGIFSVEEISEIYGNGKLNFDVLLNLGSKYCVNISANADLSKENVDNFNDMGILQAIDNVTATLNVMNILYDNNYCFNSKKIIIYGHSQGAYLSYLCNAFAPSLFSLIIDNSAWLSPRFLTENRLLNYKCGNLTVHVYYDYLARKVIDDTEILDLSYLYSKFQNNCNIISYHGVDDDLVSYIDKFIFCNNANNCIYNKISDDKVDNIVFGSTNHGLNANFIELFNYTMSKFDVKFEKDEYFDLQNKVVFETSKHKYIIDYRNIIPQIHIL